MMVNRSMGINLVGKTNKTNRSLSKVLEQLSTGKRVNRASDDAAGLAIAENLMAQVRGFKAADTNAAYAQAAMHIGEGTANEVSSSLQGSVIEAPLDRISPAGL